VTLYAYGHYGTFNYIAILKPNTIYGKTTLEPGEGPVFTRITDDINVSFTYNFQGNGPANLTLSYYVSEYLETSIWQRKIGEVQQKTITLTETNASLDINDIPPIDISSVQTLANILSQETGMTITQYNVTTTVQIDIEANTTGGSINELFTPKLTMSFTSSFVQGDVVTIEGIQSAKTGKITSTDIIYQPEVETQRLVSYALSIVSFPGVLMIIWAYTKNKPTKPFKPEALFEEFIEPYKEVISETVQEPRFQEHVTAISMKTLEDLVKVADTLIKPIVHTRKPPETHIFYVIDDATRYEYVVTESSIIERLKKEEEE
jgi:hypothetical protein